MCILNDVFGNNYSDGDDSDYHTTGDEANSDMSMLAMITWIQRSHGAFITYLVVIDIYVVCIVK